MIDKAREAFEKAVLGKYQEPFIKMNNGQYLCLTQELDFRLFKAGQASRDVEVAFLRGACIKSNPETDKIIAIDKAKYDELLRECSEAFKQIIEDTDDRNGHDVIAICDNFITKLKEALNDKRTD